ncbi:hypothetical protein ACE193_04705 [Bernardetia sp. OM2101]|uniref:hypothetical protein n=1 Tax=Bernardetia sp. OM2101 TaxID=3344876 RepID=UPI0035D0CE6F
MFFFLLKLRFKQFVRILKEFGIFRMLILLFLVFIGIGYVYGKIIFLKEYQIELVFLALIFSLHQNRKDHHFLAYLSKSHNQNRAFKVRIAEYSVLFLLYHLPLLFILKLTFYHLISICVAFGLVLLLSFYSPQKSIKKSFFNQFIQKTTAFIPLSVWEWRMALRKNGILFIPLYILGFVASWFWAAFPYILLFYSLFLVEIYNYLEPKELIQNYPTKKQFWQKRLLSAVIFSNLILFPHYLISLLNLFVFDRYSAANFPTFIFLGILGFCFLIYNLILFQLIFYKYSSLDSKNGKVLNSIPTTIFILISIFLPVSLFICYQTWKKANHKVSIVLN